MGWFGRRLADRAPGLDASAPAALDPADLPQATIDFCSAHRIHPSPPIYETVYAYLCGHTALGLAFAAERARGPLTEHGLMRLHDEHLAAGRAARGIGEVGLGLGREVDKMTVAVDAGLLAGASAGRALGRLNETLSGPLDSRALSERASAVREIGLRQIEANTDLRETLRVTRDRLGALERDLEKHMADANTDHLSKLPNRRAFDARLDRLFAEPASPARPVCLVMVDVDRFKAINDTHGHDIGDSVIRMVADVLRKGAGGYAARWGGEEFAVLLEGSDRHAALRRAEELRAALAAARWTRRRDGVPLGEITASFGVAERAPRDTAASLARRADAALYRAKSEGRNRCVFVDAPREA